MMDLKSELYSIEEGFWLQGQDHFLEHLDERCLLSFPQAGEMHGVFHRKDVAATASQSNRWRDLTMRDRHLLEVGEVAIISYRAEVTRADGQPYAALVSSGYVRTSDAWKLIFHQHSPVEFRAGNTGPGQKKEPSASVEEEIRAVLDRRRMAVAKKDAFASVRNYSQDVVLFDLAPPLATPSSEARDPARAQQWFDTWEGPITTELRDLVVRAGGDLAFASGLLHMSGKRVDESKGDFWSRTTICLERKDGEWRIVHEHNSFPMLMDGSDKAAIDLRPTPGS